MAERCAVVGIAQTHHKKVRDDVSLAGLLREAGQRALDDAAMTWRDVDAVVIGTAPDSFEGVMMPELYLADALGAAGKPIMRVHTAGSVGGSTAIVATHLVQSGVRKRVLTIAFEKQSEGDTTWGLSGGRSGGVGAGGYFAPHIRAYIERSQAPEYVGWMVAVKDRLNALKNPYAHLKVPDITLEKVRDSPMVWEPVRRLESCPASDGACAMVLTDEAGGDRAPRPPAWVHGTAIRSELGQFPGRDPVNPQGGRDCAADVYAQAGITDPRREVDVVEMYVPFSWYEPMWLENLGFADVGQGWKLTEDGVTELTGALPVNCSGGVLSSNPIGASGMLRFAEAAMQVRGTAGEHQVEGARTAVGHAYGGAAQFFAMWVVRSTKP
ncbi:thiolase domain-containing protein [Iamia sp. SCSIO 61187]|uniref:thiolase domain-containing protein n=1 Tax=Iamia sp. SCSIO 61187 TaxID=2722752 RepID=UPI002108208A|nr:thiolase domain-containing protein [Iamia sp. SCSIO 61187]QYG93631.1 thiolase domain-containing protein [Iamia sp. SCSIO 61187]